MKFSQQVPVWLLLGSGLGTLAYWLGRNLAATPPQLPPNSPDADLIDYLFW